MGLVLEDVVEAYTAQDPSLLFWRTLMSVVGYSARAVAALSVAMVVAYKEKWSKLLWLPCLINTLVMCTAFFSPIAFGYDANYEFVRGPLGYCVFLVSYFYVLVVLWQTRSRFREGRIWEVRILYLSAAACVLSGIIDAVLGGTSVNAAILISSIFYYMFIRSQDTNRDSLTKLLNRQSFYDDSAHYRSAITAVASLDMNGLKTLNDSRGHDAGDQALRAIGQCLIDVSDRNIIPYRVGGDEFLILFLRTEEAAVRQTLERVKAAVAAENYHVSAGYAIRTPLENSIDTLVKASDQQMYADKAVFYNQPSRNRRRAADRA